MRISSITKGALILSLVIPLLACTSEPKGKASGVLKIRYREDNGKPYKACCENRGVGPCSEPVNHYTVNYDLFNSDPGAPCTYFRLPASTPVVPDWKKSK